jgi:hypothetical protein
MIDNADTGWFEEDPSEEAENQSSSDETSYPTLILASADQGGTSNVAGRDLSIETTILDFGRIRAHAISGLDITEATSPFFIRPSPYASMWSSLWDNGFVVISGDLGSGRRTVALRLLADCREKVERDGGPPLPLRKLAMGWEELTPDYISRIPRRGYILDLTGSTDAKPDSDFAEEFLTGSGKLKENSVYIVIVVTEAVWESARGTVSSATFDVKAPAVREVVDRRLTVTSSHNVSLLDDASVARLLPGLDLAGGAALANALSRVGDGESDVPLEQVLDEFRDWRHYLTTWFDNNPAVLDRATLIAAAVLDPDGLANIVQARDRLLKALDATVEVDAPLVGPGLSGFLLKLDAIETDHGYSISRKRHRLNDAVLDYVWNEYPDARPAIERWLLELTKRPKARQSTIMKVARVATGMSARLGGERFLKIAEEILTLDTANRALAIEILEDTVLDPSLGHKVRARLLKWCGSDDESLVKGAAEVCAGSYGRERPRYAIFRLCRALSRRTPVAAGLPAIRACISLAEDETLRLEVVRSLLVHMEGSDSLGACRAFLGLMGAEGRDVVAALLDNPGQHHEAKSLLRDGWVVVCASPVPQDEIAKALSEFLDTLDRISITTSDAMAILIPGLVANLQRSVVIPVLAGASVSPSGGRSRPVRTALLRHLIIGPTRPADPSRAGDEAEE